jgi:putative ABC transport system permease protein
MNLLRDVFRHRARAILTISGVAVGVFALVVIGAVAENQNVYVERLVGYYDDTIIVIEEEDANFVRMASGNRPLSMAKMDELRAQPGVRSVSPQVMVLLDEGVTSVIPPMALGVEPGSSDYEGFALSAGRPMVEGDLGVALLGSDITQQRELETGDSIDVRGSSFEVVGLLERTYVNLLDSAVYIPLADAQGLYYDALPEPFQATVEPQDLVMQANVYVEAGEDPDAIAAELNRNVEGILASSEAQMMEVVDGLTGVLNSIVFSIGSIALLVSGLMIVNTMSMSVAERTREIGVRRALGASRNRLARDVLIESAVLGGLGGLVGALSGTLAALGLNAAMISATGTTALVVTVRLVAGSVGIAVVLGMLGGLYPARYATRIEPAAALAYE